MNHTILGRLNLYDKTKLSTPIFKVDIKICALPKCIVHFGPKNIQAFRGLKLDPYYAKRKGFFSVHYTALYPMKAKQKLDLSLKME